MHVHVHIYSFYDLIFLIFQSQFADVRLVCEGQEHWVHKFVLSACSEYFENMLADVPYQGCITLAPTILQKDLLSLLDFMYLGIVDVFQHELPSLVAAAEVLMIRGLAVPYEEDDSEEEPTDGNKDGKAVRKASKRKPVSYLNKGSTVKRKKNKDGDADAVVKVEEEDFNYGVETDQNPQMDPSTSAGGVMFGRSPDQNCQVTSSNAEVNNMLKVLIGKSPKQVSVLYLIILDEN